MKTLLRFLFAATLSLAGSALRAGNLTVTLAPSSAISAGAKWRVDGGSWKNSGSTVNNLSNASHTVDFKDVSGWLTPAATAVAITSGTTTTLTATYVQPASLKITLSPASGQWRVDGGTWQTSGATVTGLTPGNHTVNYSSLFGYAGPSTETVALVSNQTTTLARSYTQLAQLSVTLSPTTAQWRVDSGAWQVSGATVSNLLPGSHTVDYNAVAGYSAPSSESVTLVSGQLTTVTRSYVQLAGLTVTLTPASAQWSVDGGAWQNSGVTVANLAPGSHSLSYATLNGYTAPATENVTLVSGQTLSLSRSYVQLAQVTVTLTPSSAQWRIDSGAWLASGATVMNLAAGSHTIDYTPVTGYITPASESVTLASGQSLPVSRSYVQLAQVTVTLTPASAQWRIDGGAWRASGTTATNLPLGAHTIDYAAVAGYTAPSADSITLTAGQSLSLSRAYVQLAQVTVTLTPTAGTQWRIDNGAWVASGTTVANLTPGNHTIDYAALAGYTAPVTETVTLSAGQSLPLTRSYVQLAQVTVSLAPTNAQWRVDNGAWLASGITAANLTPGSHTIDYQALAGYTAPTSESLTLTPGQSANVSRSYVQLAQVTVTLSPGTAQWQLDGGAWQNSGATLVDLPPGSHTVSYSAVAGYITPASESVTLAGGANPLTRAYVQLAQATVTLTPSSAQWRIDGGTWLASGATAANLTPGSHPIDYQALTGYNAPNSESLALTPGQSANLARSYTAQPAQVTVTLSVSAALWRITLVGSPTGQWSNSGTTATGLAAGNYTIDYAGWPGYDAPPSENVALTPGQALSLSRTYTPRPAQIRIVLTPNSAQWRIYPAGATPGGTWNASGVTVTGLAAGSYNVEYSALAGYESLPTDTFTLNPGDSALYSRLYTALPSQITVITEPSSGQWRIYPQLDPPSGTWNPSGTTLGGFGPYSYTVDYSPIAGYTTPAPTTFTFAPGENKTITTTYPALPAQVTVTLTPSTGQWRIYPSAGTPSGAWQNSGATVASLTPGSYTIAYNTLDGYTAPATEAIVLTANQSASYSRSYTVIPAQITVTTTPASGQWRVYPDQTPPGGTWNASGATVTGLAPGTYQVAYSALAGYNTPANATVTLAPAESKTLSTTYTTSPTQITVMLEPSSGQWRVDGGAWHAAGSTASDLTGGSHLLEFAAVAGYAAPLSQTIALNAGDARSYFFLYTAQTPGVLTSKLSYPGGQWRVDGGAWQVSGASLGGLSSGAHTVDFSDVVGYVTPGSYTVNVSATEPTQVGAGYNAAQANLSMALTPSTGRWRVNGGTWLTNTGGASGQPGDKPYFVEFEPVAGYATPPGEYIRIAPSSGYITVPRTYPTVLTTAAVSVTMTPTHGQWRIYSGGMPSGAWQYGSATVTGLAPGAYTIEYAPVANYGSPTTETLNLAAGQDLRLARTYDSFPGQVTATLTPSTAQWRISPASGPASNTWLNSGMAASVAPGDYVIDYSFASGYLTPWTDYVTVASAEAVTITKSYQQVYDLTVSLYPYNAQWRVDGGAWLASNAGVSNLTPGTHTIDYSTVSGYATPPSETITFNGGSPITLNRSYGALAQVTVSIYSPSSAQWRVDGGAWQANGSTVTGLAANVPHTVDYSTVTGYVTPPSNTFTPYAGQSVSLSPYYPPLSQITVSIYAPASAQWRVDGGAWQDNGTTVANLMYDVPHVVDYAPVTGYTTPPSQTVTLYSGQSLTLSPYYPPLAQIKVSVYSPANAQWRVDGGAWQANNATVANLMYDVPHVVDYAPVTGYTTPPSQTVTLYSGQSLTLSPYYPPLAQITVSVYSPANAQWRVDGGAWQANGSTAANLMYDVPHTVDYRPVPGYMTPPPQTVTLYSGQSLSLSPYYGSLGVHRLRFFVHADLAGSLPLADVRSRAAQYAAHLTSIFTRETLRVFTTFDPANDVTVVSADPFSGYYNGWQPDAGFDLWVYATLTDNPAVGTYGGGVGLDSTGAGGARDVKFDQLYDPSALADGTPAMAQYWRQLHLILQNFERTFNAGSGDYGTLAGLHDASGVSPAIADVAAVDSATPDTFWIARFDFWTDPLTANAYANPRLGSPTSLATLLTLTSFAPATRGVINGMYRNPGNASFTLPILGPVVVKVVNTSTGALIPDATLRVWNRQNPASPSSTYEETVSTTGTAGVFNFNWSGTPLSSTDNAKLLKASATGYTASAQWATIYDAQKVKLIDGKTTFEITIPLTPQ